MRLVILIISGIIIGIILGNLLSKSDIPMSSSMKNIQEKCSIQSSDLLGTTSMEKISKCIDERDEFSKDWYGNNAYSINQITGVPYIDSCQKGYELIGYSASWGNGGVCCKADKDGHVKHCTIVRPCLPKGNNPCA